MKQRIDKMLGFTLIELMMVVGVVIILASIAAPKFYSFKIRSERT